MSDYRNTFGKLRVLEPQNGRLWKNNAKIVVIEIGEKEEEYGDKSDLLDEYYEINESVSISV